MCYIDTPVGCSINRTQRCDGFVCFRGENVNKGTVIIIQNYNGVC